MALTDIYFHALKDQLPLQEMSRLLEPDTSLCMAIKTHKEGYVYANKNFLTLMGFNDLKSFMHKTDADLYSDKKLLDVYRTDDERVYDSGTVQKIMGEIKPDRHPKLIKTMEGLSYPVYLKGRTPEAIFFMHQPKNKLITLGMGIMCTATAEELQSLLARNSYQVEGPFGPMTLARMEILCFAETMKGKHAGEIAEQFGLKQVTVESYLSNLKNKCGVGKKSELAQFFIDHKIFEKIIV
jgi:DNA-binding CsgD family transcriptional regulator